MGGAVVLGAELKSGFDCSVCRKHHEVLPLSYSIKAPHAATLISAEHFERRVVLNADQCVIDGRNFYLRGRISIPIHDLDEQFIWGVWAEISPKNFVRSIDLWKTTGRELEPEFSGWLDSKIAVFGDTLNLKLDVLTKPVGHRPHFILLDTEHPLAMEQREGISLERCKQIAEEMLHKGEKE